MCRKSGAPATFKSRAALHLENLALRRQLGVLHRSVKRPKLALSDRLLWAWLCRAWNDWRSAIVIVKPDTVIAWHRHVKSFLAYNHESRTHLALKRDARYERRAA